MAGTEDPLPPDIAPRTSLATTTYQSRDASSSYLQDHGEQPSEDRNTISLNVNFPHGYEIQQQPAANLAHSMITTVVSNGNDALNLLFEAATQEDSRATHLRGLSQYSTFDGAGDQAANTSPAKSREPEHRSPIAPDVLEMWRCSRYVKMGWLLAEEAVLYVDL